MTAIARQVAADELGAGRWRVEFELSDAGDAERARPHPRSVAVRAQTSSDPPAHVESLAPPAPSARDRFSVVLALEGAAPHGAPARYELRGDGWSGHAELATAAQEPTPRPRPAPPNGTPPIDIDYRARDFDALRTMMLAIIGERFGDGLAAHPVAQSTALVELLAYLGDALSYMQDAVATEAYLATARRRVSVTRHAALLDYAVSEGRSARTWARFEVDAPLRLPARTRLLTRVARLPARVDPADAGAAQRAGALVFETLEPVDLKPGELRLAVDERRHPRGVLAAGATDALLAGRSYSLAPGALVLIEPAAGEARGGAHVVRLVSARPDGMGTRIAWARADALPDDPFLTQEPLCVRTDNLALVEHGETQPWLPLPAPAAGMRYWPRLPARDVTFSAGAGPPGAARSATDTLHATGLPARPAVELRERAGPSPRRWHLRASLLQSGPLAPDFVVEVDDDRTARLRFGDNANGLTPPPGTAFEVRQRVGGGSAGNVGAQILAHVVSDDARVRGVTNPVAAAGGADPEPLESVRINAPQAFRSTDRAVSAGDYATVAMRVDGVAGATAAIVSSGSWPLARVRVHTGDWSVPADAAVERVTATLALEHPAGVELDVRGAVALPVTAALDVTAASGWSRMRVATALDRVLRDSLLRPDRFGFGVGLHRSDLVALVTAVPGVTDVTVRRLDWTHALPDADPREDLTPPFGHIIRIDNDPAAPQRGSVSYALRMERA